MPFHSDKQRKAVMAKLNRGNPNSDVNPTIVKSNPGISERFKSFRERLAKAKQKRIEADTVEETKKLRVAEKRLESQLKVETKRAKQREKTSAAELKLEAVKQRERETKEKLEKFTVTGKLKGRIKLGAQKFAKSRAERKEFLATPLGQQRIKEAKERRASFFKKVKKGAKAFGKVKL